jgi:hypothetical protein
MEIGREVAISYTTSKDVANRHGRYSFAIPLLDQFVRRQFEPDVFAPKAT